MDNVVLTKLAAMISEQSDTDPRLLLLSAEDNVLVARVDLPAGAALKIDGGEAVLAVDVPLGHKLARRPLRVGDTVLKYGAPIGSVSAPAAVGEWLHVHNMKSDYIPSFGRDVGDQPPDGQ